MFLYSLNYFTGELLKREREREREIWSIDLVFLPSKFIEPDQIIWLPNLFELPNLFWFFYQLN
jgi:hypothetical protein